MEAEDGNKFKKKKSALERFLCVVDSFLAIVIFSPAVVGYWRGCWQLMDIYLLPNNEKHSMYASLFLGISSGIIFGLLQDFFSNTFCRKGNFLWFFLISRLYTIIFCICSVNHWRGVWMAWDIFTGIGWESGLTSAGIGLLFLCITRGVNNILASPFVAVTDHKENYFHIPTLFNVERKDHVFFFLDLLFTVVVTGSLVVFVWRGSWVFLDSKLFPNNPTYSAWGSLIIGLTVSVIAFFLQIIMIYCLKRMQKGFWKIMIEDLYNTFCFIGSVSIWRGFWNLLNIYLYPDKPALSNALTAVGGNAILIILFCANSTIPGRGAGMDGSQKGSKGIEFRINYLRSLCKRKKSGPYGPVCDDDLEKENFSVDPSGKTDSSKINGLIDSRGRGDGNSYSDSYSGETDDGKDEKVLCLNEDSLKDLKETESFL